MGDDLLATRLDRPLLVVEVSGGSLDGLRFPLGPTELTHGVAIGRNPECLIRFDATRDRAVSGSHALLESRDGRFFVRDLGSANGLFVDGKRVGDQSCEIQSGTRIRLGESGPVLRAMVPGEPLAHATTELGTTATPDPGTPPTEVPGRDRPPGARTQILLDQVAERVAAGAAATRRRLLFALGALGVLLVAGGGVGAWYLAQDRKAVARIEEGARQAREAMERERAADRKRIDEALAAARAARDELDRQKRAYDELKRQLEQKTDETERAALQARIEEQAKKITTVRKDARAKGRALRDEARKLREKGRAAAGEAADEMTDEELEALGADDE